MTYRRIIEILDDGAMEFIIPDAPENTKLEFVPAYGGSTVQTGAIQVRHIGKWYPETLAAIQQIPESEEYKKV